MPKPLVVPLKRRSLLPASATKRGSRGPMGVGGSGESGWTPVLAVVTSGSKRVIQVAQWVGGTGTAPPTAGYYLGATGLVANIGLATDIRGPAGASGGGGSSQMLFSGSGVPDDGTGSNDDWYLDVDTGDWYIKATGIWGAPIYTFDATLLSIAALGTVADKTIYTTGTDSWSETDITSFGRSLIASADDATVRALLHAVIGTDVQAWSAVLDAWALKAVPTGTVVGTDSYTAADVLTKIKTVDGSGSGLDADTLDGHDTGFFQTALGYTPEDVANKTIDGTLVGNSDILYPSEKAVKTYADTKQSALGFTAESISNKTTDGTLAANSNTLYPSEQAVKTYADTKLAITSFTPAAILAAVVTGDGSGSLLDADFLDGLDSTAFQLADVELSAIAGLVSAADRLPYFTGAGTASLATFTATGRSIVSGASASAVRTTLGLVIGTDVQAQDAELAALAGLTSAADSLPYFTGLGTASLATFTATGRSLVAGASASAMRTTLGLVISTDVQAHGTNLDIFAALTTAATTNLTSIAGLTSAADQVPYFTGLGTAALATFTATGRSIVSGASTSAVRTTLGLVIGTDVQAQDAELAALAGLTSAGDSLPYFTGLGTASLATFTATGRSLVAGVSASAMRTTLGLVIGTDVQAQDAELAALAGLTSAADSLPYFTGLGTAALATFTATGRSIVSAASTSAIRTTLGLVIGTNVEAWSATLDSIVSTGITTAMFATNVVDTDVTLAANSDTRLASQKAAKAYIDALLAANDAMVYRGAIDCSANPNYPAANAGDTYRISVSGLIGGGSGVAVTAGDLILCNTDSTASGNQATVGTKWNVIHTSGAGAGGLTTGDIGTTVEAWNANLDAIAGLTSAADRLPYFTGSNTASLATFTATGRSIVSGASASAVRTTLGLVIGTDVQAQDAELAALAGLTSAADSLPYFTGSGAAALATFTATGRSLVAGASASAMRTTLGVVIGTDVQAQDAELAALAGLTSAADSLPYFTGLGTAALATFTATGRSIVSGASTGAVVTTLGLVIGTNVEAWSAALDTIAAAGTGTSGHTLPFLDGVNVWSGAANSFTLATSSAVPVRLISTDAGATAGPYLALNRNSASPAAADGLGGILFQGNNSTPTTVNYVTIFATILDPTAATEDSDLRFQTYNAGSLANRLILGQGLYTAGASGGDKGVDTINATTLYMAGTALGTAAVATTGASGHTLPFLDTAATWSAGIQFSLTTAGTAPITVTSTDAGATVGPYILLFRNSASPAANDVIGSLAYFGVNSTPANVGYASQYAVILDPVAGTEDAELRWQTLVAGAGADRIIVGQGLYTPGATGGDKGVNTINATTLYMAGTALGTAAVGTTGTSGHTIPFLDGANTWSGSLNEFTLTTSNSSPLRLTSTNASATVGPLLTLFRDRASPAANDIIGAILFRANNASGAVGVTYGEIYTKILTVQAVDNSIGAAELRFQTPVTGTFADRLVLGQGLYTIGATGGDKGVNTINATTLYEAGATLAATYAPVLAKTPIGMIAPYAGTTAPSGWLLCFGQLVSTTTYAALFAVLSTTYGSGSGTFGIPDLRGRTLFGQDNMGGSAASRLTNSATGGITGSTLGGTGGEQAHANVDAENAAHTHVMTHTHSHNHSGNNGFALRSLGNTAAHFVNATGGGLDQCSTDTDATASSASSTQNDGSGSAHNNVPPGIVVNYMIYAGV